jgi:hypothetical protein
VVTRGDGHLHVAVTARVSALHNGVAVVVRGRASAVDETSDAPSAPAWP